MSAFASCGHAALWAIGSYVPIADIGLFDHLVGECSGSLVRFQCFCARTVTTCLSPFASAKSVSPLRGRPSAAQDFYSGELEPSLIVMSLFVPLKQKSTYFIHFHRRKLEGTRRYVDIQFGDVQDFYKLKVGVWNAVH
jgi:hypothetical protein